MSSPEQNFTNNFYPSRFFDDLDGVYYQVLEGQQLDLFSPDMTHRNLRHVTREGEETIVSRPEPLMHSIRQQLFRRGFYNK